MCWLRDPGNKFKLDHGSSRIRLTMPNLFHNRYYRVGQVVRFHYGRIYPAERSFCTSLRDAERRSQAAMNIAAMTTPRLAPIISTRTYADRSFENRSLQRVFEVIRYRW